MVRPPSRATATEGCYGGGNQREHDSPVACAANPFGVLAAETYHLAAARWERFTIGLLEDDQVHTAERKAAVRASAKQGRASFYAQHRVLPPDIMLYILELSQVLELDFWTFCSGTEICGYVVQQGREVDWRGQRSWCKEFVWIEVREVFAPSIVVTPHGVVLLRSEAVCMSSFVVPVYRFERNRRRHEYYKELDEKKGIAAPEWY